MSTYYYDVTVLTAGGDVGAVLWRLVITIEALSPAIAHARHGDALW